MLYIENLSFPVSSVLRMLLDGWIHIGNAAFLYSFSTLCCSVFDLHLSYDAKLLSDCSSIAAPSMPMLLLSEVYHISFCLLPQTDTTF